MRYSMLKLSVIVLMLAGVVLSAGGSVHAQSLPKDVERELSCTCGCTINFEDCVCSVATAIRESAAGMLDAGRTKLEVLDGLVAQYGEAVLITSDDDPARSSAGPVVVDPDTGATITQPDPVTAVPVPDAGAIPSAIDGGGSNVMSWLLPLLGAVGGGSAVLVATQVVHRRRTMALATRQARRQQRRRSKRSSRR